MLPEIPLRQWIEFLGQFYDQYGYIIVFLSAFGENTLLGFFLPGNSLVLLGAFYARLGHLNIVLVIALAVAGTVCGYSLDYVLGRFVLSKVIDRLCASRMGRYLRLAGRLRLARRMLLRHGGKAILISHVVAALRSAIAITAGFTRMPFRTFLFYEVIAATLWNTAYGLVGYFVAMQIEQLTQVLQQAGLLIVVVLVVLYVLWRYLSPRVQQVVRKRLYRVKLEKMEEEEREKQRAPIV